MRAKPVKSRMFAIALPVVLFIAGISATCGVSKGDTRELQNAPWATATVSTSRTGP